MLSQDDDSKDDRPRSPRPGNSAAAARSGKGRSRNLLQCKEEEIPPDPAAGLEAGLAAIVEIASSGPEGAETSHSGDLYGSSSAPALLGLQRASTAFAHPIGSLPITHTEHGPLAAIHKVVQLGR